MGILMNLSKEDNVLYHDFTNAYWSIDNIIFSNGNGIGYCSFEFNAYPSKQAKYKTLDPVEGSIEYGGPIGLAYQPLLHRFEATFLTADIFPTGIPVSESDQKDALYTFVKNYLGLEDYTDEL